MDSEVADNVIGGEAAPVNMDGDLASDSDNQEGIAVAEDVVDDEEIEKNAPELSVEVTEVGELALEPEQKDDNEMVTNDSEPRPTTGISDNGEDAAQKVDALGTLQHEVKAVEGSAVVTDTLPPNDPVVTQPASQPSFGEKTLTGDVASTVPSSDPIDMINRIIANYEGTNSPATTVEVLPQSANVFPQPTAPYARPPTKNSKFIEVDPNYRMPGCCGRKLTSTTQKQSSPCRLTLRSESASRTKLGIEEDIIGAAEPPTFQHDATHIGMAKARQAHQRAQKKRTIPVVAIPPSPRCQPPTKRKNQSITGGSVDVAQPSPRSLISIESTVMEAAVLARFTTTGTSSTNIQSRANIALAPDSSRTNNRRAHAVVNYTEVLVAQPASLKETSSGGGGGLADKAPLQVYHRYDLPYLHSKLRNSGDADPANACSVVPRCAPRPPPATTVAGQDATTADTQQSGPYQTSSRVLQLPQSRYIALAQSSRALRSMRSEASRQQQDFVVQEGAGKPFRRKYGQIPKAVASNLEVERAELQALWLAEK